MAFNGSGVFVRLYSWIQQKALGFDIDSTKMDAEDNGFALGLSTCITTNGQSVITANLPMGANKLTGLLDGSGLQDSASINNVNTIAAAAAAAAVAPVLPYLPILTGMGFEWWGATAPTGYLLAFGQSLSTTTYAALFAIMGYTYGGSGANFNMPDKRGRVSAGVDAMGGSAAGNLTSYALGTTGGNQAVTLTVTQIPAHTHSFSGTTGNDSPDHTHSTGGTASNPISPGGAPNVEPNGSANTGGASTRHQHTFAGTTDTGTGGAGSHPNVQATIACNYIIKT